MIHSEIATRALCGRLGMHQTGSIARHALLALCLAVSGCSMVDGSSDAAALFERQQQGDMQAMGELEESALRKGGINAFYAGLAYDLQGDVSNALRLYGISDNKFAKHNAAIIQLRQVASGVRNTEITDSVLRNLNVAAEAGVPESMLMLAKLYERGIAKSENNPALSFQWLKRLVEHNKHPEAEYYLGLAYWNGFGTKRNEQQAKRYLESAAKSGSPDAKIAMYRLNSGFDRLVWLLIAMNSTHDNKSLLTSEDLTRYDEREIKKAKEKSSAWINAHSINYEPIRYDKTIIPRV